MFKKNISLASPAEHTGGATRWLASAALALLLAACGGGTGVADSTPPAPTVQKGYGPAQLYHPTANPEGHVLQEGDTGIVLLQPADQGALQVWFDVAEASTYGMELEDEDLASLARVQLADAATGQVRLSATPQQRQASADLAAGRYVLRMEPSATHAQSTPMFIRFESEPAASQAKGHPITKADFGHVLGTVFTKACFACDLRGAHLALLLLYDAQLYASNLTGANLIGANLVRANLIQTTLDSANLEGANLDNAKLSFATLRNAHLRGASLKNAILNNADLRSADLRDANLRGADLSFSHLQGAKLGGATWPDGRVCAPTSFLGECN